MVKEDNKQPGWLQTSLAESFGVGRGAAVATALLMAVLVGAALFWFFYAAPPKVITMTTGPVGSSFESNAVRYAAALARSGIRLKIVNSQGSQENLARLENPAAEVDAGFVQSGVTNADVAGKTNAVVSLGSVSYQPLLVFYRGRLRKLLSDFKGGRLVIGPPGSGTRLLAVTLLGLNDLGSNAVTLADLDPVAAASALRAGTIDALFLMGDSASPQCASCCATRKFNSLILPRPTHTRGESII